MIYLGIIIFYLTIDQVSKFIRRGKSDRNEIIVGYSLLIIVANFLSITLDVNSSNIFLFFFISFVILIAVNQSQGKNQYTQDLVFFLTTLCVVSVPVVISNYNFFVFRGNWWDHFNYI